ncbi:unnamed protein product [Dibothriocephalus latus]|uniref:Protein YIF1 n=1 Tax=Dibothriocephalus latus TaxID=60516 RepID=A0A3P7MU10_DIBLA|nr:unnamed protein product [Dibothriocephalus latus]
MVVNFYIEMNQYSYDPDQKIPQDQGYNLPNYFQPSNAFPQTPNYAFNYAPEVYSGVNANPSMPNQPFNAPDSQPFAGQLVKNVALHYGSEAIDQSRQLMQQKVERFISISKLKYYFAVDNGYVAKKLSVLMFPFFHRSWDLKYDSAGPVPPRADLNSPDLYIPIMAFLTYVLVAGVALGVDGRFSPESLSIFSSQSLGWLVLEVCILTFALYLLNIQSNLGYLDILAYSGYKFVHMITVIFAFLVLAKPGYYFSLIWTGLAFAFFQVSLSTNITVCRPSVAGFSQRHSPHTMMDFSFLILYGTLIFG